jgi:hypothetical protein
MELMASFNFQYEDSLRWDNDKEIDLTCDLALMSCQIQ